MRRDKTMAFLQQPALTRADVFMNEKENGKSQLCKRENNVSQLINQIAKFKPSDDVCDKNV